jgi:phage-related minor tail protein
LGVERAVTRWYLQRQLILDEIATLEAKLTLSQAQEQTLNESDATQAAEEYLQQLAKAQEKLRVLGSCPRPMMG